MTEFSGLPGGIMHSPTAEKILQPAETKADVAANEAAAATTEMVEEKRRAVQEAQPGQQDPIDKDRKSPRDESQPEGRKKRRGRAGEEEEQAAEETRLIDVVV